MWHAKKTSRFITSNNVIDFEDVRKITRLRVAEVNELEAKDLFPKSKISEYGWGRVWRIDDIIKWCRLNNDSDKETIEGLLAYITSLRNFMGEILKTRAEFNQLFYDTEKMADHLYQLEVDKQISKDFEENPHMFGIPRVDNVQKARALHKQFLKNEANNIDNTDFIDSHLNRYNHEK